MRHLSHFAGFARPMSGVAAVKRFLGEYFALIQPAMDMIGSPGGSKSSMASQEGKLAIADLISR